MSVLAWPCTCLDCGGDFTTVNPGSTAGHRAVAVVACLDCGTEWAPEINMARVRNNPGSGSSKRSKDAVTRLASHAQTLIDGGRSVADACRTVGIDRHSYYARQSR